MSISVYEAALLCVTTAIITVILCKLPRLFRISRIDELPESGDQNGEARSKREILLLVHAVDKVALQMGTQVGEHSVRVSEISESIASKDVESTLIHYAGDLLIEANRKLQVDLAEARSEIAKQRDQLHQYVTDSLTDPLTAIANRRAWDQELDRLYSSWKRKHEPFSVLLIDIDHFKKVNDAYGHMVGDQMLKAFSKSLLDIFRTHDFTARFGGEEFAVLMPTTSLAAASRAADRARRFVEEHQYNAGNLTIQISISIGVKQIEEGLSATDLMARVDEALYAAKTNGRNCCYLHDSSGCLAIEAETEQGADEPKNDIELKVVAVDELESKQAV